MAFHITVTDNEDGTIAVDDETNAAVLIYNAPEGIHAESYIHCSGKALLHMAFALDAIKERLLSLDPLARILYEARDKFLDGAVEIDVGAIKRALESRGNDDDGQ